MKSSIFRFGSAGIATLLALTSLRVCMSDQKQVSYWPFKVGSTWTLATKMGTTSVDQVIVVTKVQDQKNGSVATLDYAINGKSIQIEKYLTTAQQVVRLAAGPNGDGTLNPPLPILKYPIKIGDKWDWKGTITRQGVTFNGTGALAAVGPEQVTTPAGTFKALKVHLVVTVVAQGQKVTIPNDYWFAPNVGLVKQHASVNGVVVDCLLKSYKLK